MRTDLLGFSILASFAIQIWTAVASADIAPPPMVTFTCNDAGKVGYSGTCAANGLPPPNGYCPPDPAQLYGCNGPDSGIPTGQAEQVNEFDAGCYQKDGGNSVCLRGVEGTVAASCCEVRSFQSLCFDSPGCVSNYLGPKVFCGAPPSGLCAPGDASDPDGGCDASVICTPAGTPAAAPSSSRGGCNVTSTHVAGGLSPAMLVALLWAVALRRRSREILPTVRA